MTERVEQLTAAVSKLTPAEWHELRSWLADYRSEQPPPTRAEPTESERRAHWARHFEELEKFWGDRPPLKENIVLAMREEERY